ncbi:restriction endonuclease subunit S [Halomonas cupida]|uniref:restriction endonuclease subunit S n=1 Tax=Halomonas cupida TaxID=44933 RepID=UPI0039B36C95
MSNTKLEEFNKELELPSSWAQPGFMETFEVVSTNGKKIKQREYQLSGALPVIDQGEDLIGGYTDKLDAAIKVGEPLIVFGDHTRVFKFINHDFAPGADGVKVLRTSHSLMPKYAYHACQALRLPNRGYARHFSILKKFRFPVAPLNEQRRIVEKIESLFAQLDHSEAGLSYVQKLLARYRQSVLKAAVTGQLTADWRAENADRLESGSDLLERILQARRENWQGRGKYKEPAAPDTSDLPELPEGWVWASIDQLHTHLTSGSRAWKKYYGSGDGVFIMAQNVRPMRFDLSEKFSVDPPFDSPDAVRSEVRKDDVLITIVGANTGDVCRFPSDASRHYVCQSVALLRLADVALSPFIETFLASKGAGRDQLEKFIYGAGRPHLSFEQLRSVVAPIPPLGEQAEIMQRVSEKLDEIKQVEIACQAELARSAALRQSILKDAFSGKLVPQDPNDEPACKLLDRIRAERDAAAPKKRTRKKATA